MRSKIFANRTLQTAVLSALLGSLATYLGAHTGAGLTHASSSAALASDSAVAQPLSLAVSDRDARYAGSSSDVFTYVVKPNDTVWDLCVRSMGRYDETALAELRRLNPDLRNPDLIEVGEEIRLPAHASNQRSR